MEVQTSQEILERRKEIEAELVEFLAEAGSDFRLEDIQEIIYNEEDTDNFTDLIAMFDTGQGAAELQNIIETITDAWNYFSHKALGGLSPAEKVLES